MGAAETNSTHVTSRQEDGVLEFVVAQKQLIEENDTNIRSKP